MILRRKKKKKRMTNSWLDQKMGVPIGYNLLCYFVNQTNFVLSWGCFIIFWYCFITGLSSWSKPRKGKRQGQKMRQSHIQVLHVHSCFLSALCYSIWNLFCHIKVFVRCFHSYFLSEVLHFPLDDLLERCHLQFPFYVFSIQWTCMILFFKLQV